MNPRYTDAAAFTLNDTVDPEIDYEAKFFDTSLPREIADVHFEVGFTFGREQADSLLASAPAYNQIATMQPGKLRHLRNDYITVVIRAHPDSFERMVKLYDFAY